MSKSNENSLFGGGDEWTMNACVNVGVDQWWIYTEGYNLAVDVLVKHVFANRCDLDALVYSIVFCARHSIELSLKHIYQDCCTLLQQEYKLPMDHDISNLWSIVKPLVMKVLPNEDYSDFSYINDIVVAVNRADERSFAFRYPVDKKGNKSLEQNIHHLNICDFQRRYSKAKKTLESINFAVKNCLEYSSEIAPKIHIRFKLE